MRLAFEVILALWIYGMLLMDVYNMYTAWRNYGSPMKVCGARRARAVGMHTTCPMNF